MTPPRTFDPARRTLSFALLLVALCLGGLAFSPVSTLQATDAVPAAAHTSPAAANQQPSADESPQVAAFRQAVGGSITPLIIELRKDPAVLRKVAAEKAGEKLSTEQLISYGQDLVGEQDAFLASLASRGVRALLHEKNVTQIDGSVRHIQYRFTYLLNGFVAFVATEDIAKLKALPEVAQVSEPEQVQYHLNQAVDYSLGTQQQAADRRAAVYGATQEFRPAGSPGHPETPKRNRTDGFEGQGMNIAIIDSGVDYRHPMFGGTGLDTPFPRVSGQPRSPDDNKKVIYFYAFNEPIGDPTDDFGHGTLVASNAAGYLVNGKTQPRFGYGLGFDGQGVGPTPNGIELFGTAPQARIMAYKVCGPADRCLGDIPLSIEDAASPYTLVASGTTHPTPVPKPVADVINLSLGSTAGDPASATSRAANNAVLAGVVLVASAGNSGPGEGTIGAPGSATLAIGVAASLDPGSIAAADVLKADQVPTDLKADNSPGPPPEVGAESRANEANLNERQGIKIFPVAGGGPLPRGPENPGEPAQGSLSAHYVYVEDPNTTPPEVRNRIALVRGGTGSFFNIVNAVAVQMPAAIIITDDRESLTAVVVAGGIPVFNVNTETTAYLLNRISNTDSDGDDEDTTDDVPVGAISQFPLRLAESFTIENFQPDMAGFSSRGPNDHPNANFRTLKPDVSGPGVGIIGAATVEGIPDETIGLASTTGYTVANGTSFSAPITAGAMVLVRQRVREELGLDTTDQKDPDYRAKRFDAATVARALLQNTATNLRDGFGEPEGNGPNSVASVNDMGSGHINVAGALSAKSIMVAPALLFVDADPNTSGEQREFTPQAAPSPTPALVHIPTVSFGPVGVIGLNGKLERRQEVIIRDVTGGEGSGKYDLTVQNNRGAKAPGFEISFTAADGATPIKSISVPSGGQASFFVRTVVDGQQIAEDPTCPTVDNPNPCNEFQWYVTAKSSAQTLRMPFYYRAIPADPEANRAATLLNISTRAPVQTGDNVMIGGFIVTGNQPKRVIIRAVGPSLEVEGNPVGGRMEDPTLELFDFNQKLIATNDDWQSNANRADIRRTRLAPRNPRESAILVTLPPGTFTAVLRGKDNSTGIGLVEVFDLNSATNAKLDNISTRGLVQGGDNILIGGFIAGAEQTPTDVVVRALGPSLADREVADPLQDPTLQLVNSNGDVIAQNDDYGSSDQKEEIAAYNLAPDDERESALLRRVPPGTYTALVRGKGGSGVALVEVYDVPENE